MSDLEKQRHAIKKTFRYYMAIMWQNSGEKATNDNFAEWDAIIDGIIEQAKAEIRKEGKGEG